jgi:hypothetical protein
VIALSAEAPKYDPAGFFATDRGGLKEVAEETAATAEGFGIGTEGTKAPTPVKMLKREITIRRSRKE